MSTGDDEAIDRLIGRNIRFHRLKCELSQAKLAARIGISFQQLQKYERGVNRISASRLLAIAQALRSPIGAFFEATDSSDTQPHLHSSTAARDPARLMHACARVTDDSLRCLLAELIEHATSK